MKTLFLAACSLCLVLTSFAQRPRIDSGEAGGDFMQTRDEVLPGYFIVDIGVSLLQSAPDPMELNVLNSRFVSFTYMGNIDLSSKFKLLTGLSFSIDNYRFKDDINLMRGTNVLGEERIMFYKLPQSSIKKSKFSVTYLDVPLEFHFIPNPTRKGFRAAVGGKFGLPISAATKIKYKQNGDVFKEKIKNNFFLSDIRYGVQARVGYKSFHLFGYYGLNTLFQKDKLDCDCGGGTPISIGITVVAF